MEIANKIKKLKCDALCVILYACTHTIVFTVFDNMIHLLVIIE